MSQENSDRRENSGTGYPVLAQVVLDTSDPRRLAEFYREFLGFHYRPGEEPPPAGTVGAAGPF